eukprot:GILK01002970.1.p1 GENE.GILK01002970.1~~GILK01002970.1.p1  ORF type:complete len:369 (-),score=34.63 GILK01002970.1:299-1405(-)
MGIGADSTMSGYMTARSSRSRVPQAPTTARRPATAACASESSPPSPTYSRGRSHSVQHAHTRAKFPTATIYNKRFGTTDTIVLDPTAYPVLPFDPEFKEFLKTQSEMAQLRRSQILNSEYECEDVGTDTERSNEGLDWNINGYRAPATGSPVAYPSWSFPKAKQETIVDAAMKRAATIPDPSAYVLPKIDTIPNVGLPKGHRNTIVDQVIARSKTIPAPNAYNHEARHVVLGGSMDKIAKVTFTDEAGLSSTPGVGTYQSYSSLYDKKTVVPVLRPKIETFRRKTKEPGPGSYSPTNYASPRGTSAFFPTSTSGSLLHATAEVKRFVPGPGKYESVKRESLQGKSAWQQVYGTGRMGDSKIKKSTHAF